MKRVIIAVVAMLTLGASSQTSHFAFTVSVTTPRVGDIVRVTWHTDCDGVLRQGRFFQPTPVVRSLPVGISQARHCEAHAVAWNISHHHGPRFPVVVVHMVQS